MPNRPLPPLPNNSSKVLRYSKASQRHEWYELNNHITPLQGSLQYSTQGSCLLFENHSAITAVPTALLTQALRNGKIQWNGSPLPSFPSPNPNLVEDSRHTLDDLLRASEGAEFKAGTQRSITIQKGTPADIIESMDFGTTQKISPLPPTYHRQYQGTESIINTAALPPPRPKQAHLPIPSDATPLPRFVLKINSEMGKLFHRFKSQNNSETDIALMQALKQALLETHQNDDENIPPKEKLKKFGSTLKNFLNQGGIPPQTTVGQTSEENIERAGDFFWFMKRTLESPINASFSPKNITAKDIVSDLIPLFLTDKQIEERKGDDKSLQSVAKMIQKDIKQMRMKSTQGNLLPHPPKFLRDSKLPQELLACFNDLPDTDEQKKDFLEFENVFMENKLPNDEQTNEFSEKMNGFFKSIPEVTRKKLQGYVPEDDLYVMDAVKQKFVDAWNTFQKTNEHSQQNQLGLATLESFMGAPYPHKKRRVDNDRDQNGEGTSWKDPTNPMGRTPSTQR